jgi:hypothetical protein
MPLVKSLSPVVGVAIFSSEGSVRILINLRTRPTLKLLKAQTCAPGAFRRCMQIRSAPIQTGEFSNSSLIASGCQMGRDNYALSLFNIDDCGNECQLQALGTCVWVVIITLWSAWRSGSGLIAVY